MERPTSRRLTDIFSAFNWHPQIPSFVWQRRLPTWQVCLKLPEEARTHTHAPAHTIRDALTLIMLKLGHCAAVRDPSECFLHTLTCTQRASVYVGHLESCRNVDEENIPPPKCAFQSWKSGFFRCCILERECRRISCSIHYHPLFVHSSRTEQNRGSASEKKMNGRCGLFDFQITQASFLLTRCVNKYIIQFPWSHTISWQSSERSNRLLQGTWATVKKKKILAIWKVLTPWASHEKRQMSYPQKQLLGEPLFF